MSKTLQEQARALVEKEPWDAKDMLCSQLLLVHIADALDEAQRDRDTMQATLTIAQERGTALTEEVRMLKQRLARFGQGG